MPDIPSSTGSTPMPTSPNILTLEATSGPPTHLAVMLHGVGADAASFHDIARRMSTTLPNVTFLTPDGFHRFDQAPTGRQWFSTVGLDDANRAVRVREAGLEVSRWIDAQLDARKLGHERLVVVGFSQGSILGGYLALHRSPSPAAVVMFSGRIADDQTVIPGSVTTPVFLAHGTSDPVIPVSVVEPSVRALEAWGAKVEKHVYPGLAHSIAPDELREAEEFLARVTLPK